MYLEATVPLKCTKIFAQIYIDPLLNKLEWEGDHVVLSALTLRCKSQFSRVAFAWKFTDRAVVSRYNGG